MKYAIVTPARNEEDYIRNTMHSIVRQTLIPQKWVLINDNSTDATEAIIAEYQKEHSWIELMHYPDRDKNRAGGTKVVRVVNHGLDAIQTEQFDFIVKLDADLTLPENYFQTVAEHFQSSPQCGIAGGYCIVKKDDAYIREQCASYHVRGAFKAYRKECLAAIGGIPLVYNWDGLDELKAMSLGWSVDVLPLEVIHHRPTGKATNKGIKSSFTAGREYYRDGNDLIIAVFRAAAVASRTFPYLLSGMVFLGGFFYSFAKREKKNVDRKLEQFIRKFQYARISSGIKRLFGVAFLMRGRQ